MDSICKNCGKFIDGDDKFCSSECIDTYAKEMDEKIKTIIKKDSGHTSNLSDL